MIKNNCAAGIIAVLLLWSQAAFSVPNSQVDLDVSAESIARIALYYEDKPLSGKEFDFHYQSTVFLKSLKKRRVFFT